MNMDIGEGEQQQEDCLIKNRNMQKAQKSKERKSNSRLEKIFISNSHFHRNDLLKPELLDRIRTNNQDLLLGCLVSIKEENIYTLSVFPRKDEPMKMISFQIKITSNVLSYTKTDLFGKKVFLRKEGNKFFIATPNGFNTFMWLLDIIAKLFPIEHSFWHVNFSLVDQKEIEYLINFEFFKNCRDLEIWDKQVDGKILDKTIRAIESLKSLTVWWDLSHDFPHETIFSTVERVHYNRALALTPRDLECFEKCQYLTIKNTNFEEDSINELLWQLIEYEHDPPKEISILLKSCSTLEPHKVFSGFAVIRLKGESHSYLIINDDACDNPKTAFKVSLNQAIKRVVITDWHHPKIEHIYEMLRCMDGKTDARLELGYNKIQAQNLRIKCESVDKEFEDKNLQEFKNIRNQNIEAKCRLRFFARTIRSMGGELCKDGFYEYQLNDEECDQECH